MEADECVEPEESNRIPVPDLNASLWKIDFEPGPIHDIYKKQENHESSSDDNFLEEDDSLN